MIPLPLYAKIRNRYCLICYNQSPEVLMQLVKARPFIEKELPGIQVYISCCDEQLSFVNGEERIIPKSEIQAWGKELAYCREITNDVKELLDESRIPYPPEIFSSHSA